MPIKNITTIFIRFKSLLTFGLVLFGVSFVWFSITSLWQENQMRKDATSGIVNEESALEKNGAQGGAGHAAEAGSKEAGQAETTIAIRKEGNGPEEEKALGEQGGDFFHEYRIERERTLSEQIEILNEIIHHPDSSAQVRTDAQQKLIAFTEKMGRESRIENALMAKGFSEAIAVFQEPSVMVIVPSEGFRQDEIARIADLVTKIAECRWEDVIIIPKTK